MVISWIRKCCVNKLKQLLKYALEYQLHETNDKLKQDEFTFLLLYLGNALLIVKLPGLFTLSAGAVAVTVKGFYPSQDNYN